MAAFIQRHWRLLVVMPIFLAALFLGNLFLQRIPSGPGPTLPSKAPAVPAIEPVAASECEDLARRWIEAGSAGDGSAVVALIDFDEIARRAREGVPIDDRGMAASMTGFESGFRKQFQAIPALIGRRGSYKLVSIRSSEGTHRALIRLIGADSSLNYHDLLVQKRRGGPPRVTDLYIAASGEPITATLKRYLIPVARHPARRTPAEQEHVDSISRTSAMAELQAAGQHAKVLELYQALPESRRKEKVTLLIRLRSAQQLGRDAHRAAVEELMQHHAGDPCLALISLDYELLTGNHKDRRS